MIITRKSDYAVRIFRALQDGRIHNVTEICERENVPRAFAYKILRELEMNGLVKSERGNKGGYYLNVSLDEVTLFDIITTMEEDVSMLHCMREECDRNTSEHPCRIHTEIERIQAIMEAELQSRKISEILNGEAMEAAKG